MRSPGPQCVTMLNVGRTVAQRNGCRKTSASLTSISQIRRAYVRCYPKAEVEYTESIASDSDRTQRLSDVPTINPFVRPALSVAAVLGASLLLPDSAHSEALSGSAFSALTDFIVGIRSAASLFLVLHASSPFCLWSPLRIMWSPWAQPAPWSLSSQSWFLRWCLSSQHSPCP